MAPDIWFPHLGLEFFNVNRVVVSFFGFSIYWYALFIISGILAGYATALIEAKRTGQSKEDYSDLLIAGSLSAVVGLRLFYVIFNWENFRDDPIRIITGLRDGGLAIFGGLIAAVIVVFILSKRRNLDVWTILDTCAPSFALGQVIGRFGNFFNREAFGTFTDNIFAMRIVLTDAQMVTPDLLAHSVIDRGVEYIQVHPTFLYESMWNLVVFTFLTLYRPRKKFGGEIFWLYLLSYGFGRFFIEGLRVDQLLVGTLPVSQVMAALIFVLSVSVMVFKKVKVCR